MDMRYNLEPRKPQKYEAEVSPAWGLEFGSMTPPEMLVKAQAYLDLYGTLPYIYLGGHVRADDELKYLGVRHRVVGFYECYIRIVADFKGAETMLVAPCADTKLYLWHNPQTGDEIPLGSMYDEETDTLSIFDMKAMLVEKTRRTLIDAMKFAARYGNAGGKMEALEQVSPERAEDLMRKFMAGCSWLSGCVTDEQAKEVLAQFKESFPALFTEVANAKE